MYGANFERECLRIVRSVARLDSIWSDSYYHHIYRWEPNCICGDLDCLNLNVEDTAKGTLPSVDVVPYMWASAAKEGSESMDSEVSLAVHTHICASTDLEGRKNPRYGWEIASILRTKKESCFSSGVPKNEDASNTRGFDSQVPLRNNGEGEVFLIFENIRDILPPWIPVPRYIPRSVKIDIREWSNTMAN